MFSDLLLKVIQGLDCRRGDEAHPCVTLKW